MTYRIGIDISRYGHKQPTGVEVYSNHLIDRLLRIADSEKQELVLFTTERKILPFESVYIRQHIIPQRRLWTLGRLSREFLMHKNIVDVLFVPSHILPLFLPKHSVVVIHDVAWRHIPDAYSWRQKMLLEWSTKFSVKHATKIITVSDSTRKDLIEYFHCPPEKVQTIWSGFDKDAFLRSFHSNEDVLKKYGLEKGKYLIFVGRVEDKKNIPLLVEAFLEADIPEDIKLILVGKDGVGSEKVDDLLHMDKKRRVIKTGFLSNDDAYSLVQYSNGYVLPSKFEGFGFTVLEAYALGVPVLCSKVGALPEVAGDAAQYFATLDKEGVRKGIERFVAHNNSISPGQLEKQLAKFSWDICAREIYGELIGYRK